MKILFRLIMLLLFVSFFSTSDIAAATNQLLPKKIIVQINQNFSTQNPPENFSVIANDNYNLPNSKTLEKGSVIDLQITEIVPEKVGKQNAYIKARVTQLYIPSQDKTIKITNPEAIVKISQYEKLDIADKATNAGIKVANHFVDNIAAPAHMVKGAIENKEGNRLNSAVKETYDSSVLSYTSKGQPLIVKAGSLVTMSFYMKSTESESDNK